MPEVAIQSLASERLRSTSSGSSTRERAIRSHDLEFWYHLSSFMTLREAYQWRWSHSRHHTFTGIRGLDSEVQVPRPANLWLILADFLALSDGVVQLKTIAAHAFGIISEPVKEFVPPEVRRKMIWSCRIYVGVIVAVVLWAIVVRSILPLMFVVLPRFYGGWHHLLCSLTQHAALAEDERDHRLNTRTVYMNPVSRFLYMNMNYHVEHHIFPMVPYYALPKLHDAVKDQLAPAYPGFVAVYRELLPALIRQSCDAEYYVRRPLPSLPEAPP